MIRGGREGVGREGMCAHRLLLVHREDTEHMMIMTCSYEYVCVVAVQQCVCGADALTPACLPALACQAHQVQYVKCGKDGVKKQLNGVPYIKHLAGKLAMGWRQTREGTLVYMLRDNDVQVRHRAEGGGGRRPWVSPSLFTLPL